MKDSKLISILKTFSKDEYKEFEKFIDSPFFSTGRNLKPLYTALKKFYPAFDGKNFTRESVFAAMFADKPYNDILMRRHTSDMIKMAEGYLEQIALEKNYLDRKGLLISEILSRKLYTSYNIHINELGKFMQKNKIYDGYFKHMSEQEALMFKYNYDRDHQELVTSNVIRAGAFNISHFLMTLMMNLNDTQANHLAFNSPYKETSIYRFASSIDFSRLIESLQSESGEHNETDIICCYNIQQILNPGNEELIFKFKEILEKNLDIFTKPMQQHLLVSLQGMLIKNGLMKEEFEVLKFILERGLFQLNKNDFFPLIPYKTIINIALFNKEVNWTKKFIEEYYKKLSPEYSDNMYHYSYAFVYMNESKYEKALEECSKVKFQNIILNYDIKILMLKIYYETMEYETAFSNIDSFKHFLDDNKFISESYKEQFKNFTYFINKLIKARTGNDKDSMEELINELNNNKAFHSKAWVIQKAMELK